MPTAQITIPLDVPDVRVLQTQLTAQGEYVITIESTLTSAVCHRCGRMIRKSSGTDDWVTVPPLPIWGRPVYRRYRPKRYRCDSCEGHPTTTQQLTWHTPNSPQTNAFDTHVLVPLVNATIEEVSLQERLPYAIILGVIERRLAQQVDWTRYTELGVLGWDEIALKKGHRDFVVLVTARLPDGHVVILGVLPARDKVTVQRFLASIPTPLRETLETLCTETTGNGPIPAGVRRSPTRVNSPDWKVISSILAGWGCWGVAVGAGVGDVGDSDEQAAITRASNAPQVIRRKVLWYILNLPF